MYIAPSDRYEAMIFNCLDDMIRHDNPVRLLDKLIDTTLSQNAGKYIYKKNIHTGRPAYSPATLIKSLLYGHLNGIASLRKLEQETYINLELIWLTGNLHPDSNTILTFKKNFTGMLIQFCSDFNNVIQSHYNEFKSQIARPGNLHSAFHEKILSPGKLRLSINKFEDELHRIESREKAKTKDVQLSMI